MHLALFLLKNHKTGAGWGGKQWLFPQCTFPDPHRNQTKDMLGESGCFSVASLFHPLFLLSQA